MNFVLAGGQKCWLTKVVFVVKLVDQETFFLTVVDLKEKTHCKLTIYTNVCFSSHCWYARHTCSIIKCTFTRGTVAERAELTATEENTCKKNPKNTSILRKRLHEFDNTCCKYSKHNQVQKHPAKVHKRPKYRNVRQIQVTNVIFNV